MDSPIAPEKPKIEAADISLSHRQVNQFIQQFAGQKEATGQARRCHKTSNRVTKVLKTTSGKAEHKRSASATTGGSRAPPHSNVAGLLAAMAVQFLRVGTFVDRTALRDGWNSGKGRVAQILILVAITGMLNW